MYVGSINFVTSINETIIINYTIVPKVIILCII